MPKLCFATLSSSRRAETLNFCPLIQIFVASSTEGKTVSLQSAAEEMMLGSSTGSAMGLAPGLSLREKKSLKVRYWPMSGWASSEREIEYVETKDSMWARTAAGSEESS